MEKINNYMQCVNRYGTPYYRVTYGVYKYLEEEEVNRCHHCGRRYKDICNDNDVIYTLPLHGITYCSECGKYEIDYIKTNVDHRGYELNVLQLESNKFKKVIKKCINVPPFRKHIRDISKFFFGLSILLSSMYFYDYTEDNIHARWIAVAMLISVMFYILGEMERMNK